MTAILAYPGARPFNRDDSGKFFGRAEEATELSSLWLQHKLTFVSGPAGIGKTSLLKAGVLPLVNRNNVDLLPVGGFSRGARSPATPPGQHTPYTLALLRSWSSDGTAPPLSPFTVDEFVARHAEQRAPSVAVLAAIDQADDLFAGPPDRQLQRQRFLRELADALRHSALHLLICVRDEALPWYTDALGPGEHYRLRALDPDQARQAVEGPGFFDARAARELVTAVRTSRIVAAGATDRVLVAERVEPALLQVACARVWELLRGRSRTISPRELRRHGDVDAVLAEHCGAIISTVADLHSIPIPQLKLWLMSTFVAAVGGCQDASEGALNSAGQPVTIARALEDRHLLRGRAGQPAGSGIFRLISERIIEPLRHAPDDQRPDTDPDEYLVAAERALTAGELDLAERYTGMARLAAPDHDLVLHANAFSLLGNIAREAGDYHEAEAHYRQALELFEVALESTMVALMLVAIGRTLIDRGELALGTAELHAAALRMPADTTIQTELSAAVQELAWRMHRRDVRPGISLT